MAKYLMIWEVNYNLVPVDPKERATGFSMLMAGVKQDFESGMTESWGCFVGEGRGYCVVEGTEVEIVKMVERYSPYCTFKTYPVASAEQMNEVFQSMIG